MPRAVLAGVVCSLLFSCLGCDAGPPIRSCRTSAECPRGQSCIDNRCTAAFDSGGIDGGLPPGVDGGPPRVVTGMRIDPAMPRVVSVDGARATIDLGLVVTYEGGAEEAVGGGVWELATSRLGTIDRSSGVFTAGGDLAGGVGVTVEAFGMTATDTVTVEVERTVIDPSAPSDAPSRFASATETGDPSRRATLLYPLAGAVFPQNVYPADVQWEGGNAGDLYRVRLDVRGVRIAGYLAHTGGGFRYDWLVAREAWRALAEGAPGEDATVAVDRLDVATGELARGDARTFRFASGSIRGAIYYWDLAAGRILRIRGDGTGLESFMPNPPGDPADGHRCVACHAVSRDGRYMAAELWDGGDYGAVFDLTIDLSGDPAPTRVPPVQQFLTASFNPDATRLVANNANELFLVDVPSGARLTASSMLPRSGAAHPSWSPDGMQIVYAANTNGGWGVDFSQSDLGIIDVVAPDAFGPPRIIFPGSGRATARPTWSPDSRVIAFQHSGHSRIYEDVAVGPSLRRPGRVRMVSRDGATVWDLDRLNAGVEDNYYPTFSPFDAGGYFWLAFVSTRDYGNAQAGTRGTERRQLWVAAISNAAAPGADASEVPYWLPQQDVARDNMAAYWSEEPCRADGRTCATSSDCCSGFCRDIGSGPVCVPPDIVECSMTGEACVTDADCCPGAGTCIANRCSSIE
jgi:hypothetical protein